MKKLFAFLLLVGSMVAQSTGPLTIGQHLTVNGITTLNGALTITSGTITTPITGSTQCATFSTIGVLSGTGTPCNSLTVETNGTPNASQTILNLINGTKISITDGGSGNVTISNTYTFALQTGGTPNGSQSLLNLAAGTGISVVDGGSGTVTISSTVKEVRHARYTGSPATCATTVSNGDICHSTLTIPGGGYSDTAYAITCSLMFVTGYPAINTYSKANTTFDLYLTNGAAAQATISSANEVDCFFQHD